MYMYVLVIKMENEKKEMDKKTEMIEKLIEALTSIHGSKIYKL